MPFEFIDLRQLVGNDIVDGRRDRALAVERVNVGIRRVVHVRQITVIIGNIPALFAALDDQAVVRHVLVGVLRGERRIDVRIFLRDRNDFAIYKAIKAKKSTVSKAKAKQEELKKYIFIIDEINRGEISKIFGELFFAIDPGYRGKAGEISTQYSNLHSDPGEKFYIPENVYIIGTMNDIDRSVDSFDFAMRRRFRFVELRADERLEVLASLENEELEAEAIRRMAALNKAIAEVEDLNENYQIGASYFLKLKTLDFDQLWTDYLQPLLQEYIQGMYDEEGIMNRFARAYGYQKPARGDANEAAQDQG